MHVSLSTRPEFLPSLISSHNLPSFERDTFEKGSRLWGRFQVDLPSLSEIFLRCNIYRQQLVLVALILDSVAQLLDKIRTLEREILFLANPQEEGRADGHENRRTVLRREDVTA